MAQSIPPSNVHWWIFIYLFLRVKALPVEKQLIHPQSVLSSIATSAALVHALVISWMNYNRNLKLVSYLLFLPSIHSLYCWQSCLFKTHLSVEDCIHLLNFSLLPAPALFTSDFVFPPTKCEENISPPLDLGFDHVACFSQWNGVKGMEWGERDDVLVPSPGFKKTGALPLTYLCFCHYYERDIPTGSRKKMRDT